MLKYALLALVARAPQHGYELKTAFEELLGGTWMLNIGQVYTTLSRLEQDGLIEATIVSQELLPDRKVYSLTQLGQKELDRWMDEPVSGLIRLRDEVFLKVLAQALIDRRRARDLISQQRDEYVRAVTQAARSRADAELPAVTGLVLDALLLRLEADLHWLDLVESALKERRL